MRPRPTTGVIEVASAAGVRPTPNADGRPRSSAGHCSASGRATSSLRRSGARHERAGRAVEACRMRWATREDCHVDRTACAWLIRRFVDPDAEFVFVSDPDEVPADATPFDMRGAELWPPRRRLLVRVDPRQARARRPGACPPRRDRPRGRPRGRALRGARSAGPRRRRPRARAGPRRRSAARAHGSDLRRAVRATGLNSRRGKGCAADRRPRRGVRVRGQRAGDGRRALQGRAASGTLQGHPGKPGRGQYLLPAPADEPFGRRPASSRASPGLRLLGKTGKPLPTKVTPAFRAGLTAVKVTLRPGKSAKADAALLARHPRPRRAAAVGSASRRRTRCA